MKGLTKAVTFVGLILVVAGIAGIANRRAKIKKAELGHAARESKTVSRGPPTLIKKTAPGHDGAVAKEAWGSRGEEPR
jgi:hypothetical protein